jgi:predicted secreted Zn-dependent protease
VEGETAAEAVEDAKKRGPAPPYTGFTRQRIKPKFKYGVEAIPGRLGPKPYTGRAYTADVVVNYEPVMTLPQWTGYGDAPQPEKDAWDQMMRELRGHEDVHVRHGREAADALDKALTGLERDVKATSEEAALSAAAKSLFDEIGRRNESVSDRLNRVNKAYDALSRHGREQGHWTPETEARIKTVLDDWIKGQKKKGEK